MKKNPSFIKHYQIFLFCVLLFSGIRPATAQDAVYPLAGADSLTPSRSHYFDWINSQYEGTTEKQTLQNLEFFNWLHDEYGMELDIYSLDVGNIDDGPYTAGVGRLIPYHYGSMESNEFKEQFPNGFGPLSDKAAEFGCRLGLWMGPDGFGSSVEDEKMRKDLMISLCRDYNFMLFKLDGVAGPFRKEKAEVLIETLIKCREYTPDLIVSSHRIDFGKAEPYITHHLWEGVETYVDVFINNNTTAPHHRAGSLEREMTPELYRMYEDHGVCFSSCLDYWEDELILQAFNRSLILAPQIYGNPWFLKDDEYPRFARIFNLHRKYRDIIVEGQLLPEEQYGPYAMARGNGNTRLITLRNLSWEPINYTIKLNQELGLDPAEKITLKQYHPYEEMKGSYNWDDEVDVTVGAYRTCLLLVSSESIDEISITGSPYEVIRETDSKPVLLNVLGMPGTKAKIKLEPGNHYFTTGKIARKEYSIKDLEKGIQIRFEGEKLKYDYHRKLGQAKKLDRVPDDAEGLFEASCFAADNNALEVRCVQRSGLTEITEVKACRETFFSKPMFVNRGIWDKNLFDGDLNTFFIARLDDRVFRLDMGEITALDHLIIRIRDRQEYNLNPLMNSFDENAIAQVSSDLVHWETVILEHSGEGSIARVRLDPDKPVRYVRITGPPQRIAEVEGWHGSKKVDRSSWKASNLFGEYAKEPATSAWEYCCTLDEIPPGSYLAVALNGRHGNEGAYTALRIDGQLVGSPDRSVSYPSNTWEYFNVETDENYTYYFPMLPEYTGKKIDVVVLGLEDGSTDFTADVWITAYPVPFKKVSLELK